MDKVEGWHVGRFHSVDYESEVVFRSELKGRSYSAAKFQCSFTLVDKVEIRRVGRFRSVDYESEVVFANGVKGAELFSRKISMQFYFDGQS